jgi:hypothetical protein
MLTSCRDSSLCRATGRSSRHLVGGPVRVSDERRIVQLLGRVGSTREVREVRRKFSLVSLPGTSLEHLFDSVSNPYPRVQIHENEREREGIGKSTRKRTHCDLCLFCMTSRWVERKRFAWSHLRTRIYVPDAVGRIETRSRSRMFPMTWW